MKVDIKATNMELTPSLNTYINEKIGALERFINIPMMHEDYQGTSPVEAFVEIAKTTKHHKHGNVFKAEINIKVLGELLRTEANEWDMRIAIDEAKHLMERQLSKFKKEKQTKFKKGAQTLKRLRSISPLAWFRKEK